MSQSKDPQAFAMGLIAAARAAREHAAALRSDPVQIGPDEFDQFAQMLEEEAAKFVTQPPKPKLIIPQ